MAVAVPSVVTGVAKISQSVVVGPLGTPFPPWVETTVGFTGAVTGFLMNSRRSSTGRKTPGDRRGPTALGPTKRRGCADTRPFFSPPVVAPRMRTSTALRWAGMYLGLWLVATVIAGGLIVGGLALDGLSAVGYGSYTPLALRGGPSSPQAGLALMVVGAVGWQFGTAVAGFRTTVSAVEEETARHFDPESMKSDILTVLDDRLADMHQDISQTRRLVNRMSRENQADQLDFEFEDEL
jgi:hypothetical protein